MRCFSWGPWSRCCSLSPKKARFPQAHLWQSSCHWWVHAAPHFQSSAFETILRLTIRVIMTASPVQTSMALKSPQSASLYALPADHSLYLLAFPSQCDSSSQRDCCSSSQQASLAQCNAFPGWLSQSRTLCTLARLLIFLCWPFRVIPQVPSNLSRLCWQCSYLGGCWALSQTFCCCVPWDATTLPIFYGFIA